MAGDYIDCELDTKTLDFEQLFRALLADDGTGCPVLKTTGGGTAGSVQLTPGAITAAGAGSVAAGARSVSIANIGAAAGVANGITIPPNVAYNWAAGGDDTLAAIPYNGTGTLLAILTVI